MKGFKINGIEVCCCTYNELKELITFYSADGKSVCDIQMSSAQWNRLSTVSKANSDLMHRLADLFGDTDEQTNRDWLLNLSLKDFMWMCGYSLNENKEHDDDVIEGFIQDVDSNVSCEGNLLCQMCSHPLANNYECQDIEGPEDQCAKGFKLWLNEIHKS